MKKQEFINSIKEKYPEYQNANDEELLDKVLAKYPVYKSKISDLEEEKKGNGLLNVLSGVGKQFIETFRNTATLGERIIGLPTRLISGEEFESSAEKMQTVAEKKLGVGPGELTKAQNKGEKTGKFIGGVAEFALPASRVSKVTRGLNTAGKLATRALTSAGVATAQEGEVGRETAIAGGVEIALPGVGKVLKPVQGIISRLFKGLGSAVSGVGTESIEQIASNPRTAREVSRKIINEGQETILEENAKTIVNGVSQIRQEARKQYGDVLSSLSNLNIKKSAIKNNVITTLKDNGIDIKAGKFNFSNSEILDEKIIKKASKQLTEVNKAVDYSGRQVKNLMDRLNASKFRSANNPDRQAYNNLMNDVMSGLRKAVNDSTNKLKDANKQYSETLNLTESVENIFSKVKFKNPSEINKVAKKLENLFSKKGLEPKTIDDFLQRLGLDPEDFRTSEAVRKISTKTTGANTKGISISEILQQISSSVVTPKAVKNISILTGLGEEVIDNIVKRYGPTARAGIIQTLIEFSSPNETEEDNLTE